MPTSLETLEKLEREATAAPWEFENANTQSSEYAYAKITDKDSNVICDTSNADQQEVHNEPDEDGCYYFEGGRRANDMKLVEALRNSARELIAAGKREERSRELLQRCWDCMMPDELRREIEEHLEVK